MSTATVDNLTGLGRNELERMVFQLMRERDAYLENLTAAQEAGTALALRVQAMTGTLVQESGAKISCCARCGRDRTWHLGLGGAGVCDLKDPEAKNPETVATGGYLNVEALEERPHVWGYSKYDDGDEGWQGATSREEAIAAGTEEFEGEPFFIHEGEPFDPFALVPDASDLIERMVDATCDADPAPPAFLDDPVFFKPYAEQALDMLLSVWVRQYVECSWWKPIGKPEKITPTTGTYAEAET